MNNLYHQTQDKTNTFLADRGARKNGVWNPDYKHFVKILDLDRSHPAAEYLRSRYIPQSRWADIWYCDNFLGYSTELLSTGLLERIVDPTINPDSGADARIVFVSRKPDGTVTGLNTRKLTAVYGDMDRYITLEANPTDDRWVLWGEDRVDKSKTVWIVEAPLDALLIPNATAICGLSGIVKRIPELKQTFPDFVLVIDNEPKNFFVTDTYRLVIEAGAKIVIWPLDVPQKDFGELMSAGWTEQAIHNMLTSRTYSDSSALLEWWEWKEHIRYVKS